MKALGLRRIFSNFKLESKTNPVQKFSKRRKITFSVFKMKGQQKNNGVILLSVFKKCKRDKFTSMLKIKFESDTHFYNHSKCHFR